jgi:8-oxo-dGTP diphosphatase
MQHLLIYPNRDPMIASEKEYLQQYNIHKYDTPLFCIDVAIFTLIDNVLHVLLVERDNFPFKDFWALPGGFINKEDKNLHETALRKLKEKTGVKTHHLEQVTTIGNAQRDPRGWSITSLYMALIPYMPTSHFISGVKDAKWWPIHELIQKKLAFDHYELILNAKHRLQAKAGYTVLPLFMISAPFSLTQLQTAYEVLLDKALEKKSFRRKFPIDDLLEEVGEGLPDGGRGRIAALYRPKKGAEHYIFTRSFTGGESI